MFKRNFVRILPLALMLVISIAVTGCKKVDANVKIGNEDSLIEESRVEAIKKSGKIIVGTSADYPPYEFHKEINKKDEIVGFDIEIAKEIAKDLGVELQIKDMKFDGLLAALDAGTIDFVVAGMTPTPERAENVDFTKIYYTAVQSLVIRTEDKDKIKTLEDLYGKKVGAQKGAIQEEIAKEQISGSQVKALGKVSDLMLELKNNKIDALVVELPVSSAYISRNSDLTLLDIELDTDDSGSAIAIKKGNTDLVDEINKTLDRLINDKSIDKYVIDATELVNN